MISDLIHGRDGLMLSDEDGVTDLFVGLGAIVVSQGVGLKLRTTKGRVWFNLEYGLDREILFADQVSLSEEEIYPMRAAAMSDAINAVEYASIDPSTEFTFTRSEQSILVETPCVTIDCEQKYFNNY